jgi:molybdate transport system ATP-binding protein
MSEIHARFQLRRQDFVLDVAFNIPGNGVTGLFGPSGAGKTTVLRCIAGLERAEGGILQVNGEQWQNEAGGTFLPVHRRSLGYVFQHAGLFPHLTVQGNLEYGWKRTSPSQRRLAFADVVDWLGVGALVSRYPHQLSGGEQQRVAVARALLTTPHLLLLDEPLASLDARGKMEILPYLERLHHELRIPVIYVTHAIDELARLADYMVLMDAGRVQAAGTLPELLTRLELPLSHIDEASAVVDTVVQEHDDEFHLTYLAFPAGRLTITRQDLPVGQTFRVRILARDVSLALEHHNHTSVLNIIPAVVVDIAETNPAQLMVRLDAVGTPLLARVTRKSGKCLGLRTGMPVYAQVKSVALLR